MKNSLIKKIYISKPISYLLSFLGSPWKGKAAILMYHRILPDTEIDKDLDLGMAVSTFNFEKQMRAIKSAYKICSIEEFTKNSKHNNNQFMIVLTFDDGYKDNLTHALPILEKYKIPACIYITTRFLNEKVDMWWYELKEIIKNNSKLYFNFKNKNFNFKLKSKKQKHSAYLSLRKLFINLNIDLQKELLEKITRTNIRKNYSKICLNKEEIKILDDNPLITIGSHSHNHANLKILNNNEVVNEINKSSEILENLLKHKVEHFSYPYGSKTETSSREYKIVEELRFNSAVTGRTFPIRDNNLFSLPRIYIGNNTCDKSLINHLSGFYNLLNKFL